MYKENAKILRIKSLYKLQEPLLGFESILINLFSLKD